MTKSLGSLVFRAKDQTKRAGKEGKSKQKVLGRESRKCLKTNRKYLEQQWEMPGRAQEVPEEATGNAWNSNVEMPGRAQEMPGTAHRKCLEEATGNTWNSKWEMPGRAHRKCLEEPTGNAWKQQMGNAWKNTEEVAWNEAGLQKEEALTGISC